MSESPQGPTNSSVAQDAAEEQEYVPRFQLNFSPLEEPIKIRCKKCNHATYHDAAEFFVHPFNDPNSLPVGQIRVMACMECGNIVTSR